MASQLTEHDVHEECRIAYAAARELVFDHLPPGSPPTGLNDVQQRALDRLTAADAARETFTRQRAMVLRELRELMLP